MSFKIANTVIIDDSGNFTPSSQIFLSGSYVFNATPAPAAGTPYTVPNIGTTSGYHAGGQPNPTNPAPAINNIQKYPFSTDVNASDIADLATATRYMAGHSSSAAGYVSHGYNPISPSNPDTLNTIQKWPFSSDVNASVTETINFGTAFTKGFSSATHATFMAGYTYYPNGTFTQNGARNYTMSFATDVARSEPPRMPVSGRVGFNVSGPEDGYFNIIDNPTNESTTKYRFKMDGTLVYFSLGSELGYHDECMTNSSDTNGYISGGRLVPFGLYDANNPYYTSNPASAGYLGRHYKFPWASDTDISRPGAVMFYAKRNGSAANFTTHGYLTGGVISPAEPNYDPTNIYLTSMQKFPFASDVTGTDVGDLATASYVGTGHQV